MTLLASTGVCSLGLDLGTSSVKAVVLEEIGRAHV